VPISIDPTGSQCQLNCIATVASSCYRDCLNSCGTAVNAVPFCRRTCRNHQCDQLNTLCTGADLDFDSPNPQGRNEDYYACCLETGECDTDDEESLACRQAPERPSGSTTTTVAGATTTTTSVGVDAGDGL